MILQNHTLSIIIPSRDIKWRMRVVIIQVKRVSLLPTSLQNQLLRHYEIQFMTPVSV